MPAKSTKKGPAMSGDQPSDQIEEPQESATETASEPAAEEPVEEPASEPAEEAPADRAEEPAEEPAEDPGEPVQSEEFVNFADVNGAHIHIPHGSITVVTYADGSQRIQ